MARPFRYHKGDKIGPNNLELVLDCWSVNKNGKQRTYGRFRCPDCGGEFEARTDTVLSNHAQRCPKCHIDHGIKGPKGQYKYHKGDKLGPRQIELVSDCWTEEDRVLGVFICPDCGKEFTTRVHSITTGHARRCFGCKKNRPKDRVGERFGRLTVLRQATEEEVLERRKSYETMWLCECDCGSHIYVPTGHLTSGHTQSCGCLKSRGEEKVAQILSELGIYSLSQHTFDDCVYEGKLRFDFYLPDCNTIIEYDGEQHFEGCPTNGYWTEELLATVRARDKVKDEYCAEHDIKMIRIPYTDFEILDKDYILNKL